MLSEIKTLVDILQKLFGLHRDERASTVEQIAHELEQLSEIWRRILLQLESSSNSLPNEVRSELFSQTSHFQALKRFLKERERNKTFTPLNTSAGMEFFQTVQGALDAKGELYCAVHSVLYPGEPMLEAVIVEPSPLGPDGYLRVLLHDESLLNNEQARLLELEKEQSEIIELFSGDHVPTESDMRYFGFKERMFQRRMEEKQGLSKDKLRTWLERMAKGEEIPEKEREVLEYAVAHVRVELERRKHEHDMALQREALQAFRLKVATLAALAGDFRSQVALYRAGFTR